MHGFGILTEISQWFLSQEERASPTRLGEGQAVTRLKSYLASTGSAKILVWIFKSKPFLLLVFVV
jgi:hypothetical protein